jgi:hypothetical protein
VIARILLGPVLCRGSAGSLIWGRTCGGIIWIAGGKIALLVNASSRVSSDLIA